MNYTEFKSKVEELNKKTDPWINIEIEDDTFLRIYMRWTDNNPISTNDAMSTVYGDEFWQIDGYLEDKVHRMVEEEYGYLNDGDAYFWCITVEDPDKLYEDYTDFCDFLEELLPEGAKYISENCEDEDDDYNDYDSDEEDEEEEEC